MFEHNWTIYILYILPLPYMYECIRGCWLLCSTIATTSSPRVVVIIRVFSIITFRGKWTLTVWWAYFSHVLCSFPLVEYLAVQFYLFFNFKCSFKWITWKILEFHFIQWFSLNKRMSVYMLVCIFHSLLMLLFFNSLFTIPFHSFPCNFLFAKTEKK